MEERYPWDDRYDKEEYVYGIQPNDFIKQQLQDHTPGKVLFPAEGEGRNVVYAATLGWDAVAFDLSEVGKQKAQRLARKQEVDINYIVGGFEELDFPEDTFDCVALVYAHFPATRTEYHRKAIKWLKPGGILLLEGFSKQQIDRSTGGPKSLRMLFSEEEMKEDFSPLSHFEVSGHTIILQEGIYHQGEADILRVVGVK